MYEAMRVVNTLIKLSIEDKKPLNQLHITHLIYLAHATYLVLNDKRLINERFEAWQFGAVIPEVYNITKRYLNDPIEKPIGDFEEIIEEEDLNIIKKAYKIFINYNLYQLENITHKMGGAWHKARFDGSGIFNKIEDKDIKDEFKESIKYK